MPKTPPNPVPEALRPLAFNIKLVAQQAVGMKNTRGTRKRMASAIRRTILDSQAVAMVEAHIRKNLGGTAHG